MNIDANTAESKAGEDTKKLQVIEISGQDARITLRLFQKLKALRVGTSEVEFMAAKIENADKARNNIASKIKTL